VQEESEKSEKSIGKKINYYLSATIGEVGIGLRFEV